MKTLLTILVLSGLAVSQTTTTTDCDINGNSAHCTSKEDKAEYQDGWLMVYETREEHEAYEAKERAKEQAKAQARTQAAEAQARQREVERQEHEAWLATPEGQRQARLEYEAKQRQAEAQAQAAAEQEKAVEEITRKTWLSTHPQYKQTDANNDLMSQYIKGHGLYLGKTKSYDKAFKDLSKAGLLEK